MNNPSQTKDMNLTQLLEDWIGADDEAVRSSTQRPDNPKYWTKKTAHRNELRAELRTQIPTLLAKIEQQMAQERSALTTEQIHDQIDLMIAELESRTSKYKRQRNLVSVLRECSKKIQYETLRAATRRANKYTEEFKIKNRVYQCTSCGLWHITTKPKLDALLNTKRGEK